MTLATAIVTDVVVVESDKPLDTVVTTPGDFEGGAPDEDTMGETTASGGTLDIPSGEDVIVVDGVLKVDVAVDGVLTTVDCPLTIVCAGVDTPLCSVAADGVLRALCSTVDEGVLTGF